MRKFMLLVIAAIVLSLVGCGDYQTSYSKSYSMYFDTQDQKVINETYRLVRIFNEKLGRNALLATRDHKAANSYVKFTRGLRNDDGKLGYGKWETSMYQEPDFRRIEGRTLERTITYSMQLEYDEGFYAERVGADLESEEWQELFLLFCHEVGHGMQMDHHPDEKNVMYYLINGADGIKFDEYFAQVRAFLDRK